MNTEALHGTVKTYPTITIPFKNLKADKSFNSRIDLGDVDALAKDINKNGLIEPPVAWEVEGKPGVFTTIVGFRRFAALQILNPEMVQIQVFKGSLKEALLVNLRENSWRKDLSSFELATRAKKLKDEQGMSGGEIASAIGHAKSNVNNLIRTVENLHPFLLEAWEAGWAFATSKGEDGLEYHLDKIVHDRTKDHVVTSEVPLATLYSWTKDSVTHDQQWDLWMHFSDQIEEEEEEEEGEGDVEDGAGEGDEGGEDTGPVRLSAEKQTEFLEALKESDEKAPEWKKGAIAAMKFALGMTKNPPVTIRDKKAEEKAEKDAAKLEEKAKKDAEKEKAKAEKDAQKAKEKADKEKEKADKAAAKAQEDAAKAKAMKEAADVAAKEAKKKAQKAAAEQKKAS